MPFPGHGAQHGESFSNTRMGPLQRQLRKGEYGLFKHSPMFESDFVQISKQGGPVEIHNQEQIVTIGITASSPHLLIPDVLLLAQPSCLSEDHSLPHDTKLHPDCQVKYELSRLFPLCFVKISVQNAERQQLRFKLASGRTFYLQLCPESYKREELFDTWTRMIQLLWPSSETKFERKASGRIRSSPPPRPTPTTVSMTAWSDLAVTKSLVGDKGRRKTSKAKSPVADPGPPPRAEEEAGLLSPLPSQTWEMTETSKEELVEGNPAAEEGSHESSPPSRRRYTKESHSSRSRSRQRGTTRKPSKLLSLIRSCSWGEPRQKRHAVRSRSKEKKSSTR